MKNILDFIDETRNLTYDQTIDYLFNVDNFKTICLTSTICSNCGLIQYHRLHNCNCGGVFKEGSYSIESIINRVNKHDQDSVRYNWVLNMFRTELYTAFKSYLERRLNAEQQYKTANELYLKVNRDFHTRFEQTFNER